MPLFLITGLPGTGKSTVCTELKARGYQAYDGDEDGLAKWYSKQTGQMAESEGWPTREFIYSHSRNISRDRVEKLAATAKNKPVFLCGDPDNEDELRDLFDGLFALTASDEVIKRRLATRTNNSWGKLPHELKNVFSFKQKAYENYKKFIYITIDATQPTKDIADYIIKEVNT